MMKKYFWILALIMIIVISLAIGITISEGLTNAQIYANSVKTPEESTKPIDFASLDYVNAPTEASYNDLTRYNSNNYDVEFHKSAEDIMKTAGKFDVSFGTVWVRDNSGNRVAMPRSSVQGDILYYQPGSYKFGASSYVPSYEDTVYLSKTTGETSMKQVGPSALSNSGFCNNFKDNKNEMEKACLATNIDSCASTSCCVLLGGSKCVSGNEKGPHFSTNYGDITVRNKDVYYYQGKCYGNCGNNY